MPVSVINMIPVTLSSETNRDSEPNVAVDPADPQRVAASAFTPDPLSSGNGPIFVSTDGGNNWVLNVVLPGGNRTVDISLRFAGSSGTLYAGILRFDNADLNILRGPNFTLPGLMAILVDRASDDQPWVEATTSMRGAIADHVYVGSNDQSVAGTTGQTATVDRSQDAATAAAPAGFAPARLETRATASTGSGNQDGPSVRPAVHLNGTVYALYFGWRVFSSPTNTSDIVVARDDNFGVGATPFRALIDTDGQPGIRVVTGVSIPALGTLLGTQRIGSQLAIAVDPRDSQTVYIAWADGTAASNYTIHVRRSSNGGQTWSADLRSIVAATNPGLAINRRGDVAFLYQQLGNPGTGNRWRAHLEISVDGFTSAPTDLLLADVPDANGTYAGANPIGDYANVIAVGKDFYGVFSANNTPNNANFPSGVIYRRNANFGTNTLLANDNVTPVGVSIDPFFFHYTTLAPADDFYVRDWTDSPTSGDSGLEPSTHPVFYSTSDVWNRRGTLPGSFPNDQPENEPAGNGAGNVGDNWAFARIRRNAPSAAGPTTVTAHFLVSKLGTGSNYVDAGSADPDVTFPDPDPTVSFNAGDLGPFITPAYHWHLASVSSTHLCLAVEISTPTDPYVAPSLLGRAPGWPTTDLLVINDNNKAQRNMGLSTTPARGVGLLDTPYGLVHNAATFTRDVALRCEIEPTVAKRLGKVRLEVIGERSRALEPGATIVLKGMRPGENRWIGVTCQSPSGRPGEVLPVYFQELMGDLAVNGFGLGARIGTPTEVVAEALALHYSVLTRLASTFDARGLQPHLTETRRLQDALPSSLAAFGPLLAEVGKTIDQSLKKLTPKDDDPFGTTDALKTLDATIRGKSPEEIAVAHLALLHKIDSTLTMRQLADGDPADILQMVRWQNDLYRRSERLAQLECAPGLRDRSDRFIRDYGRRETGNQAYPTLLGEIMDCLRATAEALHDRDLRLRVDSLGKALESRDLARLQKAHRNVLLNLDEPGPPVRVPRKSL